jgi:hypothetical protein
LAVIPWKFDLSPLSGERPAKPTRFPTRRAGDQKSSISSIRELLRH